MKKIYKYHYVPILDTLKALLSHKKINEKFHQSFLMKKQDKKISSFNDSENFQNNKLFTENKYTLVIKLFRGTFNL